MFLKHVDIEEWIAALKVDVSARVEAEDDDIWNPAPPGITWGLAIVATAYIHIESDQDEANQRRAIPVAFRAFDRVTNQAITHYQDGNTGKLHDRSGPRIERLEEHYRDAEDIFGISSFSGSLIEATPLFSFDAMQGFHLPVRMGAKRYRLGYVSVRVPVNFYGQRRRAFYAWWKETIEALTPVQAYLGLGMGLPPREALIYSGRP